MNNKDHSQEAKKILELIYLIFPLLIILCFSNIAHSTIIWQVGIENGGSEEFPSCGDFIPSGNNVIDYQVPLDWESRLDREDKIWGEFPSALYPCHGDINCPQEIIINFNYLKDYTNPVLRIIASAPQRGASQYMEVYYKHPVFTNKETLIDVKLVDSPYYTLYDFPLGDIKKGLQEGNRIIIRNITNTEKTISEGLPIIFDVIYLDDEKYTGENEVTEYEDNSYGYTVENCEFFYLSNSIIDISGQVVDSQGFGVNDLKIRVTDYKGLYKSIITANKPINSGNPHGGYFDISKINLISLDTAFYRVDLFSLYLEVLDPNDTASVIIKKSLFSCDLCFDCYGETGGYNPADGGTPPYGGTWGIYGRVVGGHVVDSQGMGINGLTIRITDYESFYKSTYTIKRNSYYSSAEGGYFSFSDIPVTDTLYLEVCTHDPFKVLKTIPLSPVLPYNSVSLPDIILAESPDKSLSKYNEEIESTIDLIKDLTCYPPLGDHDNNLPPEGDYDGDGISNSDEVLFYFTDPTKITIPLYLSKGMNLYYFPSISDIPIIITNNESSSLFYYYYDPLSKSWKSSDPFLKPNHFNAIYASESGSLYLNLRNENRKPVLCLKEFSDPYYPATFSSNPADCLNQDLFDPNYFDPNASTLKVLDNPNLTNIKTINTKGLQDGKWKSSYRFFGKPGGKVIHTKSYEVCLITKGSGGT